MNKLKNYFRESLKEKYILLTKEAVRKKSEIIANQIFSLDEYIFAKTVMVYLSTQNEVCTDAVIDDALASGKKVCVPKCAKEGANDMLAYEISSRHNLFPGRFSILEPGDDAVCVEKKEIDLVLTPALALSENGARLGRGGGFYDGFLKDFPGIKAGLCFDEFLFEQLPTQTHDIFMDIVITDRRVILACRKAY